MDSRINIARSIGLKSIPQFDLNAIFRLDGIIGRQLMSNSKLDSVEIIKSIRESVTMDGDDGDHYEPQAKNLTYIDIAFF